MKVKLNDGFEVEIIDSTADDWEFLEVLGDIDEGETGLIVKAARMLLGREGVNALKEHLRDDSGKVRSTAMVDALREILESAGETKNS
jgi:hypothetical protein